MRPRQAGMPLRSSSVRPARLSTLDLVEALQLGHAVTALHDLRVLAALEQARGAEDLARELRLDPIMLRGVLEYVAARTDLVRKLGGRFQVTGNYTSQSKFLLDLYGLAFGSNAAQLGTLLRRPALARAAVDSSRHARAFAQVQESAVGALPAIIRQLGFNHLLDLGCGTASLLLQLAAPDRAFVGWGLEANPAMCQRARKRIRAAGLGQRVRVWQGDAFRPRSALPATVRTQVQSVVASQLANELFGTGSARAVTWLRQLHAILPGRPLLLCDYYGQLGTRSRNVMREVLLHDYVQVISGQGVPPPSLKEWRAIYSAAGCRLVHVMQDPATTLFVHIVVL